MMGEGGEASVLVVLLPLTTSTDTTLPVRTSTRTTHTGSLTGYENRRFFALLRNSLRGNKRGEARRAGGRGRDHADTTFWFCGPRAHRDRWLDDQGLALILRCASGAWCGFRKPFQVIKPTQPPNAPETLFLCPRSPKRSLALMLQLIIPFCQPC
ncbi:hypothetical protein J3F84DRAFT_221358 [Trichoderma pleuroticola]